MQQLTTDTYFIQDMVYFEQRGMLHRHTFSPEHSTAFRSMFFPNIPLLHFAPKMALRVQSDPKAPHVPREAAESPHRAEAQARPGSLK